MDVENSHTDHGPSSAAGATPTAATVLLVEDNEDNILTVADYLSFKNYRVVVARNGRVSRISSQLSIRHHFDGYSDAGT